MAIGILLALAAVDGAAATEGEKRYLDYYAARQALDRGDCAATVRHLDAYLRNHAYVRERYPDHYLEVRFAIDWCTRGVRVRGVGDEPDEHAPLPDHPPMAE